MFKELKNKAISSVVKYIANKFFLGGIGKVSLFKIDSDNKRILIEATLIGEKEPIVIEIEGYEIESYNDEKYLKFSSAKISREWMNKLLNDIIIPQKFPDKKIKVDKTIASLIEILI